jgi:hypothetical protein
MSNLEVKINHNHERAEIGRKDTLLLPMEEIRFTKLETLFLALCLPIQIAVERVSNYKMYKEIRQMRKSLGLPTNEKELGI